MQMPPRASLLQQPPKTRLTQCMLADSRGTVAIEYALIGGMTAVIAIAGMTMFGDSATGLWAWVGGELSGAMSRPE
jgi:Flp pilus assembly pilin Flp